MSQDRPATERDANAGFYVDDIAFAGGLVAEQTPLRMATAAALGGFRPPPCSARFRYCDLGCGDGITALAIAAMNPRAEVVAVDFNALHIEAGRERARQFGLDNVRFLHAAFEQLPQHAAALGSFDLVAMNGIYAWLEAGPLAAVVGFLRDHLQPGGLFHVETMNLPGMASVPPLWNLLQTLAPATGQGSRQRAEQAMRQLELLSRRGFAYLSANPRAASAARYYLALHRKDPEAALDHFVHNAMASGFRPRYVTETLDELRPAGLRLAGRQPLLLNDPELAVPPAQVPTLRDQPDPALRELITDFVRNEQNRRDVYIKDSQPDPQGARAFLEQTLLLLPRMRSETPEREVRVIGGHLVRMKGPVYESLFTAPMQRPACAADLLARLDVAASARSRAVARAIATGQFFLCLPDAEVAPQPAALPARLRIKHPVNAWLLQRAFERHSAAHLVSPLAGGAAIELSVLEVIVLQLGLTLGLDGLLEPVLQHLAAHPSEALPLPQGPLAFSRVSADQARSVIELLRGAKGLNLLKLDIVAPD